MIALDQISAATTPDLSLDLVTVAIYSTPDEGFERGLVALAIGRPFWLVPSGSGYGLLIERASVDAVQQQLTYYEWESARTDRAPSAPAAAAGRSDLLTPLGWGLLLIAAFQLQKSWTGLTPAGVLDPRAVFEGGQVWRLFTSLFLHADPGHLLSNAISGIFVFAAVLGVWGRLRGWLLIGFAAAGGNLVAAGLRAHDASYRSIGSSTAVFAGLGLLTGQAIRAVKRVGHPHRWRSFFVPLAAGLTMLGLFGAGGLQIDVVAHATGFTVGVALGLWAAPSAVASNR